MTELRYPDVELEGPPREEALRRCRDQRAEWNVAVPD